MPEATPDPLDAVLDTLIPPGDGGTMPGAGCLGLAAELRESAAEMGDLLESGLRDADARARERGAASFADLSAADRTEVLREIETSGSGFVPGLVFQLFALYYRHPRVLEALGLEARPPHPKGYELEAGELGALERVRARGRLYREA